MTDFIIENETHLRLGVFLSILITMMAVEAIFPRKSRTMGRAHRWVSNLLLIIIDGLFVRLLFPIVAVGIAALSIKNGWGLFNFTNWPIWLEITLAIIILDMMIYWQHVATHHIPLLWALHKVHHADRDIDVTILNGCAMFNHSNVKLPLRFDRFLRVFIVTPDMHRVHHSILTSETNSNYGFSLSLWDRLFKSYTNQPSKGHDEMIIGLEEHQSSGPASLSWSLLLPFKSVKRLETWL